MDRILKILLTAVGIFIAYIWLGQIIKSCNPPKSVIGNVATPSDNDAYSNTTNTDLPKDDFFEESSDTVDYFSNQSTTENSNQDQTIDYEEIDAIANGTKTLPAKPTQSTTEKVKPVATPPAKTEPLTKPLDKSVPKAAESTSISSTGSYAVHAGSFIQAKNADDLVTKLRNKGYKNAEKVVYDNSEYSTVVAGRSNDHQAATNLVAQLKRNGFDAIVVKRN